MITQIYSLQYVDEALESVEAGADRIGVLVGTPGGSYPCAVVEEQARKIFEAIKGKAVRVLISVLPDPDEIIRQTIRLKPEVLHLCAEYEGDARFREKLRQAAPDVQLMEAVGVGTDWAAVEDAKKKAEYADILILDSISTVVPGVGAAGVTHDWNIDKAIVESVNVPCIIAGGLGPDNVRDAILAVGPAGVDSLTKTSIKENGVLLRKDTEKVRQFCTIAHEFE